MLESLLIRLKSLCRSLFRRAEIESDLDEELRAYAEESAAEYRRAGLSEEEARLAALRDLGGVDHVKESVRDAWAGQWLAALARDVRYSGRALLARPAFTVIAVVTLALGLAGATAVFSVLNGVLLRPPPGVMEPAHVVAVDRLVDGVPWDGMAFPDYEHIRRTSRTFKDVAAYVGTPLRLRAADGSRSGVVVHFVTGSYFPMLGVRPALGRVLGEADAAPEAAAPVAVVSHDFWQGRLGGDTAVLGRTLDLADASVTVVGVAAAPFEGTLTGQDVDVWLPLPLLTLSGFVSDGFTRERDLRIFSVVGRLGRGSTAADAASELGSDTVAVRGSFGRHPEFGRRDAPFFRLLGGSVTLLLLLACANAAVLFLLRASSRRQELAARLALGAPRSVLARQLLVEGALVSGAACLLGAAAAAALVGRTAALTSQFGDVAFAIDGRVLAFSAGAAALTALLVSVLPVLRLGRVAPMHALRIASAGGVRGVSPAQRVLVVFQVAVSLTLVATSTMIFGTLQRWLNEDPGFDPTNVAMIYFDPRQHGWDAERTLLVLHALQVAADAHPEIAAATLGTGAPLLGRGSRAVYRDGEAPPPAAPGDPPREDGATRARFAAVAPGYFRMLGIPLAAGRGFLPDEGPGTEPVAVVSRRLARSLWGDEDAVGRWLQLDRRSEPPLRLRVVGVVEDHKHASVMESDAPVLWVPIFQSPPDGTMLIARGRAGVPTRDLLIDLLAAVDPEAFPDAVWTMRGLMDGGVSMERRVSTWIGVAGGIALFLSALGVYGVVGYVARERTRELAVRSALGALPRRLTVELMREGVGLSLVGGAVGAVLLFWTQSIVRRSFEGMPGVDLPIVAGCAALLVLAMALASFLPARRVARTPPTVALRTE